MKINIKLLAAILLFGCSAQNEEVVEIAETDAQHDTFDIPVSQMEANGMQIAQVRDTLLSANVPVNGIFVTSSDGIREFSTPIEARVSEVFVLPGSEVKRGQPLMRLESKELIDIEQQLVVDEAELTYWKEEVQRQKILVEANAGASKVYSEAKSKLNAIEARVAGAKEKLSMIGVSAGQISAANISGFFNVYASFDGFVSDLNVHNGQVVAAMSSLCFVRSAQKLTIEANVFAADREKITTGQQVTFTLNNEETVFTGQVITASSSADQQTSGYKLIIAPAIVDAAFFEGRTVKVFIETEEQNVLAIPSSALAGNPEAPFVFELLTNENGSMAFQKKYVTVLFKNEDAAGIALSDLSESAYILISGIHLMTFE
jgi:cobalt-zinc-cadmium efflux system membrane fusion protein